VRAVGECRVEQRQYETRVGGIEQDVAAVFGEGGPYTVGVRGIEPYCGESALVVPDAGDGRLGSCQVVVGDDHVLEEGTTGRDPGDRGALAARSDHENSHGAALLRCVRCARTIAGSSTPPRLSHAR
jgi:hypothetical protein